MFSYKGFMVLSLSQGFGPLGITFSVLYKIVVRFHSFVCGYPVLPKPVAEETIIFLSNGLGTPDETQLDYR